MAREVERLDKEAQDDMRYFKVLDDFAVVVNKLNLNAIEGKKVKDIRNRFKKLAPAFVALCGADLEANAPKKKKPVQNYLAEGWGK